MKELKPFEYGVNVGYQEVIEAIKAKLQYIELKDEEVK